jgi:YesN/AraC family two-component response regulator
MNPSEQARPTASILVVEDNKSASTIISRLISINYPDVAVYVAGNGKQGLKLFKDHLPEIVIADICMPEMDGIEMARAIKSIIPDTKFIVFSAYADGDFFEQCSKIGIQTCLAKPFDLDLLMTAIRQCIDDKRRSVTVQNYLHLQPHYAVRGKRLNFKPVHADRKPHRHLIILNDIRRIIEDKRTFKRLSVHAAANIYRSDMAIKCEVEDLSMKGVFLKTSCQAKPDDTVAVTIYNTRIRKKAAKVVRVTDRGIGLQFERPIFD